MTRSVESAPSAPKPDTYLQSLLDVQKRLDGVVEARQCAITTPHNPQSYTLHIHTIGAIQGGTANSRGTIDARTMEAFFSDWQTPYKTPGGISVYGGLSYISANRPNDAASLIIYRKSESTRKPEPKMLVSYRGVAPAEHDMIRQPAAATQRLFDEGEVIDNLDWLSARLALEEKRHGKNRSIPAIEGMKLLDTKHARPNALYDILNLVVDTKSIADLIG